MKKNDINYEFNPIKETKDGKNAERVIWSTKSLNTAVEAINAGLPLKANPFVGKVTQLLKPDLVYKRTEEEIDDYLKCKQDPVYFASKCFLMTPSGLQLCKLRDYQIDYLHHLQNNRFSILLAARQSGKCLSPLSYITIKTPYRFDKLLKKYYFYIENNNYIINLPFFELYNLYSKQSFLWKLKYNVLKMILWLEKKDKKLKKKRQKDIHNIGKL